MKKIVLIIGLLISIGFAIAIDSDGDGIDNSVDNCYNYYNPNQDE